MNLLNPMTFDEALRQALRPEAASPDFREALMALAGQVDVQRGRARRMRSLAWGALLLAGLSGAFWTSMRQPALSNPDIAQAALSDFMSPHRMGVQGPGLQEHHGDPDPCTRWSERNLGFPAPLPKSCSPTEVLGARACAVKGQKAAYYLLTSGRALYVFDSPILGCGERPEECSAMAGGFQAKAWNEGNRGYVLIEPRG